MLVERMSVVEAANEILEDYPNVVRKARHYDKPLRRLALKSKNKKVKKLYKYHSPRNNDWLIYATHNTSQIILVYVVIVPSRWGLGAAMTTIHGDLLYCKSHFFDRYRERHIQDIHTSKIKTIELFFDKNTQVAATEREGLFICGFEEGLGLGEKVELESGKRVTHLKTFVSNTQLFSNQNEDQEELLEYLRDYQKSVSTEFDKLDKELRAISRSIRRK